MFNKLLEISDIPRYPGIRQKQVETGADHTTQVGLIGIYLIRDMLAFIRDYPDCKDLEIDLGTLALKALLFDHTIEGYQVGSMSKEYKYYGYDVKSKLKLDFLYDPWHLLKDDIVESHILKLADLLTVLRKCMIEIRVQNDSAMA